MTTSYWDGTTWQNVSGIVGPPGPPGPLADPMPPSGPAGADLAGTYPNPTMAKQRIGGLLDVRRIFGTMPVNTRRAIVTGQNFYVDAGVTPVQLSYTPPVACWWDVDGLVGILQKGDAAYHMGSTALTLSPADMDGITDAVTWQMQHSTVQTYTHRPLSTTFRLAAGTAYTVTMRFAQLAAGGTWTYEQSGAFLWMGARAWAA